MFFRKSPTLETAISSLTQAVTDLGTVISTAEEDRKNIATEIAALKATDDEIAANLTRATSIREKLSALLS